MRLYLSAVFESAIDKKKLPELIKDTHVLHSFAYSRPEFVQYYSECKSLLMDSGAFTIMGNKKNNFDPLEYTKKYAQHVKENNVDLFMEMDIESVFGFDIYKDCLHCLQDITGKDPIYVFHKWRGLDYYKELVKKYDYIALGDVSLKGGSRKLYQYFPWFIKEAHKNNCKVHGLAFTSIPDLQFMPFDSVDSSSWKSGDRFARCSRFDGHTIKAYDCKRTETRKLDKGSVVQEHDFLEWKKLSQYFDSEYEPIW